MVANGHMADFIAQDDVQNADDLGIVFLKGLFCTHSPRGARKVSQIGALKKLALLMSPPVLAASL
jgi:hypothetical protein